MKIINYSSHAKIAELAKKDFVAQNFKDQNFTQNVASLIPTAERNLTMLYLITGEHFNPIMETFMHTFLNLNEENTLFELLKFRQVMPTKQQNIMFYTALYLLSSTPQEIAYFNTGIENLYAYFQSINSQTNSNYLKEFSGKDAIFVTKCGRSLFLSFPHQCGAALPDQYIMGGGDVRIKNVENALGSNKIQSFRKNLKELSENSFLCKKNKNKNLVIPHQQNLDRF